MEGVFGALRSAEGRCLRGTRFCSWGPRRDLAVTDRKALAFDPIASLTFLLNPFACCFEKSLIASFGSKQRERSSTSSSTPSQTIRVKWSDVTQDHGESDGKEKERAAHERGEPGSATFCGTPTRHILGHVPVLRKALVVAATTPFVRVLQTGVYALASRVVNQNLIGSIPT